MSETNYTKLIELLSTGEKFSYAELELRMGISERQIRRLMKYAKKSGEKVAEEQPGKKKFFWIPVQHRKAGFRVDLSQDELLALTVAADAARNSLGSTSLGSPLRSGIEKLVEHFPEELVPLEMEDSALHWHFSSNPVADVNPEIYHQLVDAIREEQQIIVEYYSASSNRLDPHRRLDPYALALRGSSWLLVAWCHDRNAFRDFSVPAISNVRISKGQMYRRDNFNLEEHFRGRFGATGGKIYEVLLQVEADRIPWFRRKVYHPSQQLTEQEDGTFIVQYSVAGLEDIRSFAQSWGDGVTVLAPKELVAIMRKQAQKLAERYSRNNHHPTDDYTEK